MLRRYEVNFFPVQLSCNTTVTYTLDLMPFTIGEGVDYVDNKPISELVAPLTLESN